MLEKKNLELLGDLKQRIINAKSRFSVVIFFLFISYFLITIKIFTLSINKTKEKSDAFYKQNKIIQGFRADIVDRNGVLLATTIIKDDLVINPRKIREDRKDKLAKEKHQSKTEKAEISPQQYYIFLICAKLASETN